MSGYTKKEISKIINTSRKHPTYFTSQILGDNLWGKQKDIIKEIQNNDTTVASCHGAGKSFIASRIVLHTMSVHPGTQVITTAPTDRQVKNILWKEIRTGHKNANIPLGGKVLTQQLQVDDDWFALGFATDDTNQFQGFHAKRILVIADEAAGVSEAIFNGIDGITSGANSRILYIGNPTSRVGRFYESHRDKDFSHFSISAFDTPNFTKYGITYEDIINNTWQQKLLGAFNIDAKKMTKDIWEDEIQNKLPYPQLVTPKWVAERYEKWGAESALFQAKVLGKFPEDEEFTIIPVYIWKGAQADEDWPEIDDIHDCRIGLDVARFGGDASCIVINVNEKIVEKRTLRKMDTTKVTNWTDRIIRDKFKKVNNWKDIPINVDVIGVGGGVADQLRNNKGYTNVTDLVVSEKAKEDSKFINKRAEMYWNARQGMKDGIYTIGIHDEDLENQITSIRYEFNNGRVKVEAKEKIRKRIGESPDEADGTCMALYNPGKNNTGFLSAWQK